MKEKQKHIDKARKLYLAGYNCAQSTSVPFSYIVGMDESMMIKASSAFGGGVAKMKNVCGVVSGIALIFGLSRPELDASDADAKANMYDEAQKAIKNFTDINTTVICSELLDNLEKNPSSNKPYDEKPCLKLVEDGAAILCDYLGIV